MPTWHGLEENLEIYIDCPKVIQKALKIKSKSHPNFKTGETSFLFQCHI